MGWPARLRARPPGTAGSLPIGRFEYIVSPDAAPDAGGRRHGDLDTVDPVAAAAAGWLLWDLSERTSSCVCVRIWIPRPVTEAGLFAVGPSRRAGTGDASLLLPASDWLVLLAVSYRQNSIDRPICQVSDRYTATLSRLA